MSETQRATRQTTQKVTPQPNRRRQALIFAGGIMVVSLLLLLWISRHLTASSPIDDPSYYTGAFRNHNGDLVSPDGKILEKGHLPARRTKTPSLN
jgi:hypothetical protein